MRIALCYHGLIRGYKFPYVRESHHTNIITPLTANGHTVDVFVHTFDKEYDTSILETAPKVITIESDASLTALVDSMKTKYIFPDYYPYSLRDNYFKDMYTRQRVYTMMTDYSATYGVSYDWIICVNPGQLVERPLPNVATMDNAFIYISDQMHNDGYFGRFAIGGPQAIKAYTSLFNILLANKDAPIYMSNPRQDSHNRDGPVNIYPETTIKYILNKYGYYPIEHGKLLNMSITRVRSNGGTC